MTTKIKSPNEMENKKCGSITLEYLGIPCAYHPRNIEDVEKINDVGIQLDGLRNNERTSEKVFLELNERDLGTKVREAFYKSVEKEKLKAAVNLGVACTLIYLLNRIDVKPAIEDFGYIAAGVSSLVGLARTTRAFFVERYIHKILF